MKTCIGCGKSVLLFDSIGPLVFCKSCGFKIQLPFWKNKTFSDMNEIRTLKEKVLALAQKNGFSLLATTELRAHFEALESSGLIAAVKGGEGQTLKVFKNYCIVDTTSAFSVESISEDYAEIQKALHPEESFFSKNKDAIIRGVLNGKILQTGVALAANATANAVKNEFFPDKKSFPVCFGEQKILFSDCADIKMIDPGVSCTGYIKFIFHDEKMDDVLFFFGGPSSYDYEKNRKKVRTTYVALQEYFQKERQKTTTESEVQVNNEEELIAKIKKYKELLDDGVITQEEFAAKKKQLLGL